MNCEQDQASMQLKPQDIVVLLKLVGLNQPWSYRSLALELFMSTGEVHNALDRATRAQLFDPDEKRPRLQALEEFLVHGLKYAFPAERGALSRGMPTSYAAPPLNQVIVSSNDPPPVWADPEGTTKGYNLQPLYDCVPRAAKLDKRLYELLALVDAIRDGRARERKLAAERLHERMRPS
jgi:hypothetical protein